MLPMASMPLPLARWSADLSLAWQSLRLWTPRQYATGAVAALGVALLVGVATVLIPNPVFGREIEPVWWNYPAWIVTSVLSGLLMATYVRTGPGVPSVDEDEEPGGRSTSRVGIAGGVLAWFAVGCPVCNKIALLALGYSGAITWFAPLQPILAVAALVLTAVALVWRLRGQVACPVPAAMPEPAR